MNNQASVFWSRVAVGLPDECWEWQYTMFANGYGLFYWEGKNRGAHRAAFELVKGRIPEGHNVLHTCDNRRCVNPSHLYAGTFQDNADDATERERWNPRKGESHPWTTNPELVYKGKEHPFAKLTDEDVLEIRRRYSEGALAADVAKDYPVSEGQIMHIVRGLGWQHITQGVDLSRGRGVRGAGHYKSVVTPAMAAEIKQAWETGEFSQRKIGRLFGVSQSTVLQIVNGKHWTQK